MPTLVSTLAISCVFTSVVFLDGPAKYLFTPLGLAVVFAMLASYGLSRTLTPITIGLLLQGEKHHAPGSAAPGLFTRITMAFEHAFERLREGYRKLLTILLHRRAFVPIALAWCLPSAVPCSSLLVATSSPSSTEARSSFTFARPRARGSRIRNAFFRPWKTRFARSFPKRSAALIVDNIGSSGACLQSGFRRRFHDRNQRRRDPGGA